MNIGKYNLSISRPWEWSLVPYAMPVVDDSGRILFTTWILCLGYLVIAWDDYDEDDWKYDLRQT